MKKILVAMSGGVDSSAACVLLKNQGFDVTGVTLLLKGDADEMSKKAICDTVDKLGIEHHYLDCREEFFQRVIRQHERFEDMVCQNAAQKQTQRDGTVLKGVFCREYPPVHL